MNLLLLVINLYFVVKSEELTEPIVDESSSSTMTTSDSSEILEEEKMISFNDGVYPEKELDLTTMNCNENNECKCNETLIAFGKYCSEVSNFLVDGVICTKEKCKCDNERYIPSKLSDETYYCECNEKEGIYTKVNNKCICNSNKNYKEFEGKCINELHLGEELEDRWQCITNAIPLNGQCICMIGTYEFNNECLSQLPQLVESIDGKLQCAQHSYPVGYEKDQEEMIITKEGCECETGYIYDEQSKKCIVGCDESKHQVTNTEGTGCVCKVGYHDVSNQYPEYKELICQIKCPLHQVIIDANKQDEESSEVIVDNNENITEEESEKNNEESSSEQVIETIEEFSESSEEMNMEVKRKIRKTSQSPIHPSQFVCGCEHGYDQMSKEGEPLQCGIYCEPELDEFPNIYYNACICGDKTVRLLKTDTNGTVIFNQCVNEASVIHILFMISLLLLIFI